MVPAAVYDRPGTGAQRFARRNVYRASWMADERTAMQKAGEMAASAGETVYVYAMMDHAVAFGWWRDGRIVLILGGTEQPLDSLRHVRELRLFGLSEEFKLVRMGEALCCRRLAEEKAFGAADETSYVVYEEKHKLWGSVRTDERPGTVSQVSGWCALTSDRGTCLYVPQTSPNALNIGLVVRSYIEFSPQHPGKGENDIGDPNLYRFVDERFVAFADWP